MKKLFFIALIGLGVRPVQADKVILHAKVVCTNKPDFDPKAHELPGTISTTKFGKHKPLPGNVCYLYLSYADYGDKEMVKQVADPIMEYLGTKPSDQAKPTK